MLQRGNAEDVNYSGYRRPPGISDGHQDAAHAMLGVEEVVEADNGQTAVEMARQHAPSLAILDLDIPRISGLDVIPRLKLVHPSIRVLVLSGHDPATFAPRAMRCGVHGFVGKSQEMKEIMRGVEAVLAGYTVFPVMATG